MLFKRVSRTAPEQIFVVVKNVSGGTMTAGYWAAWDTGASADGVRVTQQGAATLGAVAGVADADIANNDYGLLQVYGYRSSAYIYSSTGTSAVGDILFPVASEWGMSPYLYAQTVTKGFGFLCAAVSASSSSQYHTTGKVFIRCLG
jgi:hypothetical protein